jgi:hypothetical protein
MIHFLGDVLSPPLIGAIADRSSLGVAVMVVPAAVAVGGVIWLMAARAATRAEPLTLPAG